MAVFPTIFFKKKTSPIFGSPNKFKGLKVTKVHMHKIILVQDPL
jgi:hypothetical protein